MTDNRLMTPPMPPFTRTDLEIALSLIASQRSRAAAVSTSVADWLRRGGTALPEHLMRAGLLASADFDRIERGHLERSLLSDRQLLESMARHLEEAGQPRLARAFGACARHLDAGRLSLADAFRLLGEHAGAGDESFALALEGAGVRPGESERTALPGGAGVPAPTRTQPPRKGSRTLRVDAAMEVTSRPAPAAQDRTVPARLRDTRRVARVLRPEGELLGDVRILELLGEGAMGRVFLGVQEALDRKVAVKFLNTDASDPENLERFRREYMALADIVHPNLPRIWEVGEMDGVPYYVTEHLGGGSLEEEIEPDAMQLVDKVLLLCGAAWGLGEAHSRGLVHRDVKPANILLDEEGIPKVVDFGLVRIQEPGVSLTRTGTQMGSPYYMAPELVVGRVDRMGPPTDVWACGVILYRMLYGRRPFEGTGAVEVMNAILETRPRFDKGPTRYLTDVCRGCLEKEPERRLATCAVLAELLEVWILKQAEGKELLAERDVSSREGRHISSARLKRSSARLKRSSARLKSSSARLTRASTYDRVEARRRRLAIACALVLSTAIVAGAYLLFTGRGAPEPSPKTTAGRKTRRLRPTAVRPHAATKRTAVRPDGAPIVSDFAPALSARRRRIAWEPDGAPMVLVPAGRFLMGSDAPEWRRARSEFAGAGPLFEIEDPERWVDVDSFYIDVHPVTWGRYRRFLAALSAAGGHSPRWCHELEPRGIDHDPTPRVRRLSRVPLHWMRPALPVVCVTWWDSYAYARWAGKSLPSEAMWEKAARWDPARRRSRRYPWGDRFRRSLCNTAENWSRRPIDTVADLQAFAGDEDLLGSACFVEPVGSRPGDASPYGAREMAGGVWEWTQSFRRLLVSGPSSGWRETLRGGAWSFPRSFARAATRLVEEPGAFSLHHGFRTASRPAAPWRVRMYRTRSDPADRKEFARATAGLPAAEFLADGLHHFWNHGPVPGIDPEGPLAVVATRDVRVAAGWHEVRVVSCDGVRVKVGGKVVVRHWQPFGPKTDVGFFRLAAGTHRIVVELFRSGGPMALGFSMRPLRVEATRGALIPFTFGVDLKRREAEVTGRAEAQVEALFAGDKHVLASGRAHRVELRFWLPGPPAVAALTLEHLTAYSRGVKGNGYAPVDISVNGEALRRRFCPRDFNWTRASWNIWPYLRAGWNRVRIVHDDLALTTYWIRALRIKGLWARPDGEAAAIRRAPPTTWKRDGARMVEVEGGAFRIGSWGAQPEPWDDHLDTPPLPRSSDFAGRRVTIGAYRIDRHPVTWRRYRRFLTALRGVGAHPSSWCHPLEPPGTTHDPAPRLARFTRVPDEWMKDELPVVCVTWWDASAYARWAGKVIPSEAMWEKAARWDPDARMSRRFPWGPEWDPGRAVTVERFALARLVAAGEVKAFWRRRPLYRERCPLPAVGTMPGSASPWGAHEMAGTVREWTSDFAEIPGGRKGGSGRAVPLEAVVRGGSWWDGADSARAAARMPLDAGAQFPFVGFRTATLPAERWRVSFYRLRADPVAHPGAWRSALAAGPLAVLEAPCLQFQWGRRSPAPGVPRDWFATVATRKMRLASGRYEIVTLSGDGVRVFVDGNEVLSTWSIHPDRPDRVEVDLKAGVREIRVEHFDVNLGSALCVDIRKMG